MSATPSDKSPADRSSMRFLTALPVFNEARHVEQVLDEVVRFAGDVLVVDDGSTDGTRQHLERRSDVLLASHEQNRGYGAALRTAFDFAVLHRYDVLVTIDCDGQHEPQRIVQLAQAVAENDVDIASGSRYFGASTSSDEGAPVDRRRINLQITEELNCRFGLQLTDAFCGFKAYRVASLAKLQLTDSGYAMPLELWVQAAHHGLRIVEVPVPLIYLDEERSFGGALDDADTRLQYYHRIIDRAVENCQRLDADETTNASEAPTSQQGCPCR